MNQATWQCLGWLKHKILIYSAYKLSNRFDSALCEGASFSLFWRNARRRPLHVEVGRPWQDGGEASPGVRLAPHTPAYFRPLMQFDVSLSQTDVSVKLSVPGCCFWSAPRNRTWCRVFLTRPWRLDRLTQQSTGWPKHWNNADRPTWNMTSRN